MRIPGFRGLSPRAVAVRAGKDFVNHDMPTYAAALAFRALLAFFPFALFLLALLGSIGLTDFFDWLVGQAQTALPQDAASVVGRVTREIRNQATGGLLSFGIVTAIWVASTAVRSLMTALNAAYDVEESRPVWKRYPLSVAYTLGLAAMLIAAAALMLVGPQAVQWVAGHVGLGGLVVALWAWLRWPAAVLLLLAAVAVAYYGGPGRRPAVPVRDAGIGAGGRGLGRRLPRVLLLRRRLRVLRRHLRQPRRGRRPAPVPLHLGRHASAGRGGQCGDLPAGRTAA